MSCTSKFSSYVTIITNFFIVIVNELFIYPTSFTSLKLFFSFSSHDQIFVKMFINYFFTVFMLLKNCFNTFVSRISPSQNNRFTIFIINANKFVSKTTRDVILIFFRVRTFISFNTL